MSASVVTSHLAPIVVVEDSDEDFDTLLDVARCSGMKRVIHRALSGGACLAMLKGEDGGLLLQTPALILMDLNSHGVDGREALAGIKNDRELNRIPVVVLTTSANAKDIAFCYEAGANAYHVKPVRHDHYVLMLGAVLNYWLQTATIHAATVGLD